jgi:hypothetical protein
MRQNMTDYTKNVRAVRNKEKGISDGTDKVK